MKKTLLTLMMAVVTTIGFTQDNAIDKYFSQFNTEEATKVHITGKMFELLAELDATEDQEAVELLQGITAFNAVITQNSKTVKTDFNQANKTVGREFDELMTINDQGGNATFYINESNGVVSEMLMIAHGLEEFVLVSITGNIDLKSVSKIMKHANMGDYMNKTSIKNMDEFKIYPNPASTNDGINIELPEGLVGGNYQIFDLQGKLLKSGVLNQRNNQIAIKDLNPGKYLIKITKGEFDISKKLMVQ